MELKNLPNSIRKIIFHKEMHYDKNLNSLPDSIEFIRLPIRYDKKILVLPKSLKVIQCHHYYKFIDDYKKDICFEFYSIKN